MNRLSRSFAAVLVLAAPLLSCSATAGLEGIERSILREPVYQSGSPQYALVAFGAEASHRVWLVFDGATLHVDRNGNGDLTEEGEAVPLSKDWIQSGELRTPDGRSARIEGERYEDQTRLDIRLGKERYYVGRDPSDRLHFADRPGEAPVIHVGGPLSFRLWRRPPVLIPDRKARINVSIGTPGIGKGSFAALACCTILRRNTAPVAEIAFPAQDPDHPPLFARAVIDID